MNKKILILTSNHKEWISMVKTFGLNDDAEDIVQEMYMKVDRLNYYDKFIENDRIQKGYVWFMLRSLAFDFIKNEPYKESLESIRKLSYDQYNEEKENYFNNIIDKFEKVKSKWHTYDQLLLDTYFKTNISIRKLSKGSNISLTSMCADIKKIKSTLKQELLNDYNNYING